MNLVTTDQRNSHVVHYGTPSREADAVAFGSLTNFEQVVTIGVYELKQS